MDSRWAARVVRHVGDMRPGITCSHTKRSWAKWDGEGVGEVYYGDIQWGVPERSVDMRPGAA